MLFVWSLTPTHRSAFTTTARVFEHERPFDETDLEVRT
jgi:hypothetical protein